MAISGLTLIGEAINDSVPSTRKLFEAADYPAIQDLARTQDRSGAAYIDVNVGQRPGDFLADIVRRIQAATAKPLSIDTPDFGRAEAALKAYDLKLAAGRAPILNSISPLRLEMLGLRKIVPFRPILLVSERLEAGRGQANVTDAQVHQTAQALAAEANKAGIPIDQCLIDPAISPIATDFDGHLARVLGAMRLIHADPALAGYTCRSA